MLGKVTLDRVSGKDRLPTRGVSNIGTLSGDRRSALGLGLGLKGGMEPRFK